VVKPR